MAHMRGPTLRRPCALLARDVRYVYVFFRGSQAGLGGALPQSSMLNQNDTCPLGKCGAAALTARPLP